MMTFDDTNAEVNLNTLICPVCKRSAFQCVHCSERGEVSLLFVWRHDTNAETPHLPVAKFEPALICSDCADFERNLINMLTIPIARMLSTEELFSVANLEPPEPHQAYNEPVDEQVQLAQHYALYRLQS